MTAFPTHVPTPGRPFVPSVFGVFDDFATASVSTTADAAVWRLSGASAAAVLTNSSRATDLTAGPGILALASGSTNQASLQLNGEPFRLIRSKRLWAGCRLALNDVDATQLWFGLSLEDTALLASVPSDYVGFLNVDADNKIHAGSSKNSSVTLTDTLKNWGTTDSVFRVLTFEWDGQRRLAYFVDGIKVHESLVQVQENNDNVPDDEDLTLGVEILGSAGKSTSIDYLYCVMER